MNRRCVLDLVWSVGVGGGRQFAAQVQELITDEQPRNQLQGFNLLQQTLNRAHIRPSEQEFIVEFLTEGIRL
jgi:hypothetical protein